jgi:DNA mismatch repair protein MutS
MDVLEEDDQVVFLRQVVPGAADRSYGIHVAQLAGIPRGIIRRAQEVLADLEQGNGNSSTRRDAMRRPEPLNLQLTMFDTPSPALERLREIDVEAMSPLEAINALFELKRLASSSS